MRNTAENVSKAFEVSRDDQDSFALLSQLRYQTAFANGYFDKEIGACSLFLSFQCCVYCFC